MLTGINLNNETPVKQTTQLAGIMGEDVSRKYYKGKSFRWAGYWKSGEHYFNDEYIVDFVSIDGAMCICQSSHFSNESNKPVIAYDAHGSVLGLVDTTYWQISLVGGGVESINDLTGRIEFDKNATEFGAVKFAEDADTCKITGQVQGLGTVAAKDIDAIAQLSSDDSEIVNDGYIDTTLGFVAGESSGLSGRFSQDAINLAMSKTSGKSTYDSGFTIAPESTTKNVLVFTYMPKTSLGVELSGIATPTGNASAANKKYVDNTVSTAVSAGLTWIEI